MPRLKAPERKEQLISVATRLFAIRGYDATTTAAIAEAAGITEPVLYRHFESKKELFIAILRNSTELLMERWNRAGREAHTASAQLKRMAELIYESAEQLSDAQRVTYSATTTSCDPEVREVIRLHALRVFETARAVVLRGQQAGEFRNDLNADAMSWALINHYTGYSIGRLHFSATTSDIRIGTQLLIDGLMTKPGK